MYQLYSALLALALLVSLPYWLIQWVRHGKYRAGLRQRLGRVPSRLARNSGHPVIWAHAVSVGEVLAISGLVVELKRAFPRHRVLVSTTTATGQELAQSRFGEDCVFYFPLDFAFAIKPYLRRLRPELVVIAETEFWPNFLRLAHAGGARIAVVNARISDRSFPRYRRWRKVLRRVLRPVDVFLAQTEEDRQRLLAIGASADRVQVSGNLKFDVSMPAPPPIVASLRSAFLQARAQPVVVCGSTVEGEEKLLLDAFGSVLEKFPRAILVLAPRHPERFEGVGQLLEKAASPFWRRSTWAGEPLGGGVLLLDSIGELGSIYALADLAFVGGSLVPRGGHNIVEPAQHGIPILVGPYTENFRDIVRAFQANRAVRVVEAAELSLALIELASDEAQCKSLGGLAAETVRAHAGATQRILKALGQLLGSPSQDMTLESASSPKERGLATPPR
jgi:3-deoxy-D-manno-octulosonic-acid transferase